MSELYASGKFQLLSNQIDFIICFSDIADDSMNLIKKRTEM